MISLLFKIILTALLICYVFNKVDINIVIEIFKSREGMLSLTVGSFIMMIQMILMGLRFPFILKLYKLNLSIFSAIRIWFIGSFFTHSIISFIGGDGMRVLSLMKHNINAKTSTQAILLDRVIGFCCIVLTFVLFLPILLNYISEPHLTHLKYSVWLLAAISLGMIFVFLMLGKIKKRSSNKILNMILELGSNSVYLFQKPESTFWAFFITMIAQMINILLFYVLFKLFNENVDFLICCAFIPFVSLVSMLPISVAGWGLREGIMLTVFSILGIANEKILSVSLSFGLIVFICSLPGFVVFLLEQSQKGKKIDDTNEMLI